jgi:hypothetical protein
MGLLVLLVVLGAVSGFAGDWMQFRGPNGSGVSDTTGLPVEFGPGKNVLWKTELPPGHSSPVLAGDRIFLTAIEDDQLFTICLDRNDGRILWRRQAPRERTSELNGFYNAASPSPVSDGENVFVFFQEF